MEFKFGRNSNFLSQVESFSLLSNCIIPSNFNSNHDFSFVFNFLSPQPFSGCYSFSSDFLWVNNHCHFSLDFDSNKLIYLDNRYFISFILYAVSVVKSRILLDIDKYLSFKSSIDKEYQRCTVGKQNAIDKNYPESVISSWQNKLKQLDVYYFVSSQASHFKTLLSLDDVSFYIAFDKDSLKLSPFAHSVTFGFSLNFYFNKFLFFDSSLFNSSFCNDSSFSVSFLDFLKEHSEFVQYISDDILYDIGYKNQSLSEHDESVSF